MLTLTREKSKCLSTKRSKKEKRSLKAKLTNWATSISERELSFRVSTTPTRAFWTISQGSAKKQDSKRLFMTSKRTSNPLKSCRTSTTHTQTENRWKMSTSLRFLWTPQPSNLRTKNYTSRTQWCVYKPIGGTPLALWATATPDSSSTSLDWRLRRRRHNKE